MKPNRNAMKKDILNSEFAKLHGCKHIHMKCFPKPESLYLHYKGYFSVALLACTDANALFTTVRRDFSKKSDSSIFTASTLRKMLDREKLHTLYPAFLPLDKNGTTFPYYLVAD
jgi:hypothetical protein